MTNMQQLQSNTTLQGGKIRSSYVQPVFLEMNWQKNHKSTANLKKQYICSMNTILNVIK